ncbi:conserved hypothetical protein [Ricinus communis]|uniref:Uncharacterized protein n=1 Tax=Ricinus communis TaxID=3988 RepID=B9TAC2_RICCO|nr:conserved hypothetical protein [Ricinus communis]
MGSSSLYYSTKGNKGKSDLRFWDIASYIRERFLLGMIFPWLSKESLDAAVYT